MDASDLIRKARLRASMTQAELAVAAGTSQPAVAAYESGAKSPSVRTLDRLVRASGSALHVSLRSAPTARGQLLAILRSKRQAIQSSAKRHRVRNIRVFGSVARGEETLRSDLDLLVDFDAARHGVLPLIAFAQDVQKIIGRKVDATTVQLLRPKIRVKALVEAIPL